MSFILKKPISHSDIQDVPIGTSITSYGRISRISIMKKFWYLKIRTMYKDDITLIADKSIIKEKPSTYSAIKFEGIVSESPSGNREIKLTKVLYYSSFDSKDLLITPGMSSELLRGLESQRMLDRKYQYIFYIYPRLCDYLRALSKKIGMLEIRPPLTTFSDCEGGGEVFKIVSDIKDFYKRKAYLTVSSQVEEETATQRLSSHTYVFARSFRSDPSRTRFHVSEFDHYEPELVYVTLDQLMDVEEYIIKSLFSYVLEQKDIYDRLVYLKSPVADLKDWSDTKFARISYTDAIETLMMSGQEFQVKPYWGLDLGKEHERWLCEKHFKKPTFVYKYPSKIKSFYMRQCPKIVSVKFGILQVCEGVDLLMPGIGELCGGSTREYRYDVLLAQIKERGLDPKDYEEYLSLRKQGGIPTGGFGLGFDRLMMVITGTKSIRDVVPFPRYYGR